jgi:hypothetical protein
MLGQGLSFLKTLIKSSLDNYVLPGTLTGTEILFIYMRQWKRDVMLLASATRQSTRPNEGPSDCHDMTIEHQNDPVSTQQGR